MTEEYGIIKEAREIPKFPVRELLKVPHNGGNLIVGYRAFGRDSFYNNVKEMNKSYTHPVTRGEISFREPTTAESISASWFDFKNLAKKDIFDTSYLQAGIIVRTQEGVFANPPKDKNGKVILDENILKNHLNGAKKVNGIYLVENDLVKGLNDFGFAPYESFEQGFQSVENFVSNPKTNGLARVVEHSSEKIPAKLKEISSNYGEFDIFGFDEVSNPVEQVFALGDNWCGGRRLNVNGGNLGGVLLGRAFGVFDSNKK